jgi:hypothetical protein
VKSVGAARNGTAGRPICVPRGTPATPITEDDIQAYNDCSAGTAKECANITSFWEATGCGSDCVTDVGLYGGRTGKFCQAVRDEHRCARTIAPCYLPGTPMPPAASPAAAIPAAAAPAPGPGANGNSGAKHSSSSAAVIGGGVAGGVLALTALLAAAALLVRRRRRKLTRAPPEPTKPRWATGTMPGAESQSSLGSKALAPAERVKVTYLRSKGTLNVTQASAGTRTLGAHSAVSSITSDSSARDVLDAQLDYIDEAREGLLSRTIWCAPKSAT